jgi:hypothetical protein
LRAGKDTLVAAPARRSGGGALSDLGRRLSDPPDGAAVTGLPGLRERVGDRGLATGNPFVVVPLDRRPRERVDGDPRDDDPFRFVRPASVSCRPVSGCMRLCPMVVLGLGWIVGNGRIYLGLYLVTPGRWAARGKSVSVERVRAISGVDGRRQRPAAVEEKAQLSRDRVPAPTVRRKRLPHSWARSTRDSWMKSQKPCWL